MQTSTNGNRDLDLFYAMLQDRARDVKMQNSLNRNSNLDLFGNLPRYIHTNILSRLSIPCIIECKAVCKAWRDLINRDLIKCREFGNRHRHLVVFPYTKAFPDSMRVRFSPAPNNKIEKLNDIPISIVHVALLESVPLVRSSVDGLILLLRVPLVRSSVDGLILLLRHQWTEQQQQHLLLCVCNPITREYVRIPNPSDRDFGLGLPYPPQRRHLVTGQKVARRAVTGAPPLEYGNYSFGFGVSKISKQYKLVWISQSECRVYTLGTTGQWRSIAPPTLLECNEWNMECAFVGGNLYWLDPPESQTQTRTKILCFDLETEAFTHISVPPPRGDLFHDCCRSLCVLDGCLCLCDVYGDEMEIWLMTGQGEDWSKKVVINEQAGVRRCYGLCYGHIFPIKVLGDGGSVNWNENGMLLADASSNAIHYYSSEGGKKRIRRSYPPGSFSSSMFEYPRAAVYTPSFLSLKTMLGVEVEDVRSF